MPPDATSLDRRRFLQRTGLSMAALGLGSKGSLGASSAQSKGAGAKRARGGRPNVLWIQTDEQRPDSLGCYGSEWAHTPNIDRLAREGTRFHECHVQSPTCVPSRTSMLTCRYPQETGVLDNKFYYKDGVLPEGTVTFPELFERAGYQTASIGKHHTPNTGDTVYQYSPKHSFKTRTWQYVDPFQHFATIGPWYLQEKYQDQKEELGIVHRPKGAPIIIGGAYPEDDKWGADPATFKTDKALKWMEEAEAEGDPWFLRVSYYWPHTPATPPHPYDRIYEGKDIKVPIDHREQMYANRSKLDKQLADEQGGNQLSPETWRWVCQTYYGLCSYLDSEIGRLLFWLDQQGLRENTIVVFSSDHGRNNGEYGCCEKNTFDHQVWRVPFLISWPGQVPQGKVDAGLCEMLDLGPTLLHLAGLDKADGMQGRDLFADAPPEAVYGMINRGGSKDPADAHDPDQALGIRRVAVRSKRFRYDYADYWNGPTKAGKQYPSLYDIENDPEERFNLIDDPEYRDEAERHHRLIEAWKERTPNVFDA